MDDVTVTLTRAEWEVLMERVRPLRPVVPISSHGATGPTLYIADMHAAIDKLEAAGRRPLNAA